MVVGSLGSTQTLHVCHICRSGQGWFWGSMYTRTAWCVCGVAYRRPLVRSIRCGRCFFVRGAEPGRSRQRSPPLRRDQAGTCLSTVPLSRSCNFQRVVGRRLISVPAGQDRKCHQTAVFASSQAPLRVICSDFHLTSWHSTTLAVLAPALVEESNQIHVGH